MLPSVLLGVRLYALPGSYILPDGLSELVAFAPLLNPAPPPLFTLNVFARPYTFSSLGFGGIPPDSNL